MLAALILTLVAVPAPIPAADAPPAADKQKQIEDLEKQIADIQKRLAELKAAPAAPTTPEGTIPDDVSKQFAWRCIGPANMGGRISAIAAVESDPSTYFVATASGGLLKTVNNGTTFEHQFDKEGTVSIGDVAVALSDPNVVWVGSGEANPRNSVSYGDGVYKSVDGGKTWKNIGLGKTFQIGKILIHPKKPDTVYVGALGRLYGPSPDRGLYKTEDGGKTWVKVLFVDDKTGVIDARMDPADPETLIVAMWERKRDEFDGFFGDTPVPDMYGPIVTHGAGGGLFKSKDGGKTWKKLTDEKLATGLPTIKLGRIGLDYSRKTKGLVVAIIDTEKVGTGELSKVYMGVVGADAPGGGAKITQVTGDGPAAKAGLKVDDIVTTADGTKVETYEKFVDYFLGKKPGDKIKLTVTRDGKEVAAEVTLGTRAEPAPPPSSPPVVGIRFEPGDKLVVAGVADDGPAAKAGIRPADEIVSLDGKKVVNPKDLATVLTGKKAGDVVKVTVSRGVGDKKEEKTFDVALARNPAAAPPGRGGRGNREAPSTKPYGATLGGQQANVQNRQGKDGYQTGGVYVSKDNGDTWTRVNSLNPRPMYFSVVRVDPTDDNVIYVLGFEPVLWRSNDGGKTFASVPTARGVHPDAHAMWIDPTNPRRFIVGCDGGFYTSYDRGATWEHLNTLALGQYYHVATDTRRPYRVYGGLQDNGSWGGPSHALRRYGPVNEDWMFLNGGDGFVCRVDPTDPDLVYAESQNGAIGRRNLRTGEFGAIRPPRKQGDEPLRFNWNTPFILSHHNPSIFYCGAQFVFRSVSRGDNLKPISADLTRTKKGSLVQVAESPRTPDVLWAGSDDGYVWVSKDAGTTWTNVSANLTPAGLPGPRWVACLEPSRDKDGRCYAVFDGHRSDDDRPYVFVTDDFGATWKAITSNLPVFGSTRVVREDIVNTNILYLGTEFGAWVSANRGTTWTRLGAGLPTVAVHEFAQPTVANDLVAGTHGRSVWVLDIASVRQMKPEVFKEKVTLFNPAPAVRWKIGVGADSPYSSNDHRYVGQNPAPGATVDYLLTQKADKLTLKVTDAVGRVMKTFDKPGTAAGLHRLSWDLRGPGTQRPPTGGRILTGSQVQPGAYRVVLTVGDKEYTQSLMVELDPNASHDLITTESVAEQAQTARRALRAAERAVTGAVQGGRED